MNITNFNNQNCMRFSNPKIATRYPSEFRQGHWRDEHEKQSVLKALRHFPKAAHILDLPCGSGRLTKILLTEGYKVTAGDVSMAMLKIAKRNFEMYKSNPIILSQDIQFKAIDILDTGFKDNEFDGVVCYRLFHHFCDSNTRQKAMAELKRISRGPVLISFFNSFSISTYTRRTKYLFAGRTITDRVPIKMSLFLNELESQGLLPIDKIPVRWGVSPMWDVVALPYGNKL